MPGDVTCGGSANQFCLTMATSVENQWWRHLAAA